MVHQAPAKAAFSTLYQIGNTTTHVRAQCACVYAIRLCMYNVPVRTQCLRAHTLIGV